jgi:excisionase family DNA binding protein
MPHESLPLKLFTEKQLAEVLAVSPRTARRLRAQKILPFYKLGRGLIRYDQSQCVKALGQYRVSTNGESKAQN